jgi:hypothetical protein
MPYWRSGRPVRVEHHQVVVEHGDDVLDLVHEAPYALQLAHVGNGPWRPANSASRAAAPRGLEVRLQQLASRSARSWRMSRHGIHAGTSKQQRSPPCAAHSTW